MHDVPAKKSSSVPAKQFVAPAHPQSHHLHTLPPREKTTRTLILDHTAWRHGRTRFAQGRCELGMDVRIKGKEGDLQDDEPSGKRPAFYIGACGTSSSDSGSRGGSASGSTTGSSQSSSRQGQQHRHRYSNFGEPPEVDVMSSDDEEQGSWDSMEGVSALAYGKRYRRIQQRRQEQLLRTNQTASHAAFLPVEAGEDSSASDCDDSDNEMLPSLYQDTRFAPLFAARADGMEKVLCSILQPNNRLSPSPVRSSTPPPYSIYIPFTNTQYSFQSTPNSETSRPRILPNGLRLRLALLDLVNDLFKRQGSISYEASSSSVSKDTSAVPNECDKPTSSNLNPSSPGLNTPPAGLAALVQVSNQPFFAPPTLPSFRNLSLPSSSMNIRSSPVNGPSPYHHPFGNSGPTSAPQSRPPALVFPWTRDSNASSPNTLARIQEHESNESATSPANKVYRHTSTISRSTAHDLPASWTDHVPKATMSASGKLVSPSTALIRRASGRAKDLYAAGCYSTPSSTSSMQTFRRGVPTFSHRGTILTAPSPPPVYPTDKLKTLCPRHLRERCRICEPISSSSPSSSKHIGPDSGFTPSTTRIGAGLLNEWQGLLRERERGGNGGVDDQSKRTGSVLADMLPKFLRLSALIAIELGREARGEEPEARNGQEETDLRSEAVDSSATMTSTGTDATSKPSTAHAQPTRAWFALLSGLITRAVLEGYVARGWKGADYIEILMGVGLGIRDVGTRRQSSGIGGFRDDNQLPASSAPVVEDARDEFDPDEMPGLVDACKVLFNGLVRDATSPAMAPLDSTETTTGAAEQEYVQEMEERLSEFLGISHSCPDFATHLTRLSEKYPAEPVERAALRFCEAIAKWRGKPELEMYKKLSAQSSMTSTPALPIHALLSSPAPQKPPIQRYFTVPFSARKPTSSSVRGLKRQRSVDEEVRGLKKEKVEMRYMAVDTVTPKRQTLPSIDVMTNTRVVEDLPSADWVGPYGV